MRIPIGEPGRDRRPDGVPDRPIREELPQGRLIPENGMANKDGASTPSSATQRTHENVWSGLFGTTRVVHDRTLVTSSVVMHCVHAGISINVDARLGGV